MGRIVIFLLAILACCCQAASAQLTPPLTGRPANFSDIVGRYEIEATATPTEVMVEEPITLRITITGDGPADYEPHRTTLRLFPAAWDKQFYLDEQLDHHHADRVKKTWLFVYHLRPKHTNIDAIEGIKLVYYNPASPEKDKFETRYAERIPIRVKPRPDEGTDTKIEKPVAPASFFQSVPIDIDRTPFTFTTAQVLGFLLTPPAACLLGAWIWRRYGPDEQARRRRIRDHAAARAIAQLQEVGTPMWDILVRYLRDRFEIVSEELTPAEASASLMRRGFAKELCVRCAAILQACDAQRFANTAAAPLGEDAIRMIASLEADRCAR